MKRLEKFGVSIIYLRQTHLKSLMLHHAAQSQHMTAKGLQLYYQGQRVAEWSLQRVVMSVGLFADHPFIVLSV